MSDTPRTSQSQFGTGRVSVEFAQKLERELNSANAIIRQQQLLDEENLRLQARIKQLEELGKELRECANLIGNYQSNEMETIDRAEAAVEAWDNEANL